MTWIQYVLNACSYCNKKCKKWNGLKHHNGRLHKVWRFFSTCRVFTMAIPGYPLGRVMIKLWDEIISFRSSIGLQSSSSNSKSNSLWPKVASVARLAVDLPPSLAQHAAVHPLVAEVAGEAGLVPSLAGCSHQFSNEDRFAASWTDVCSTPLWLGLVTSGCCCHVGWIVWHEGLLGSNICFGFVVNLIRVGLVSITIIHGQRSSSSTKSIAFRPKIFPVAWVAEHLVVMLGDGARVQHLPTMVTGEAEAVVHVS